MKQFRTIWKVLLLVLFVAACSEDNGENDEEENNETNTETSVSLDDVDDGEGSYVLDGDIELSGSGNATHHYYAAQTSDETSWSIHAVEIEDLDNNVTVEIRFHILDDEADEFSGKEPESATYRVYEPGLSTPSEDYAKVSVSGDGLSSYFATDEESQLELTVDNGTWESAFENKLDDYETDETVTIYCAFIATAE